MNYYDEGQEQYEEIAIQAIDNMPLGAVIEYSGNDVPVGWEKINDYSTTEIKTGKLWTDGKPIYRKCYDAKITTQTANIDVNNFVSNVDKIVSLTGGTKGNNFAYGFYWKDNTDHYLAILSQNSTNLNIQIGTSYPSVPFNATVIVEYTKTTD